MPPTPRLLGPTGRPLAHAPAPQPRAVRGRFDVAQSNAENARLWAPADGLSARASLSPEVRLKLRNRARYECDNNTYAEGIVQTLANDVVGTGPRLQLMTGDAGLNRKVGDAFEDWTAAVGLAEKLRTMRRARAVDGEAFAVLRTNPGLATDVQLDLHLVEADQFAAPMAGFGDPRVADGIRFDGSGNPVSYTLLREHPGDHYAPAAYGLTDVLPARLVLHWFRARRPGQVRGVPDITPALPLFGLLRRYTLAVIAAAETAADFAAVLYSELGPDTEDFADGDPFETLEIDRRMMTTLPRGWKMGQFKAEQPVTTYAQFKAEILNEIARCLGMPFNVAAGNSSGYNYSSGRLDHQTYYKSIGIDQYHLETAVLDRLFAAWLEESWLATDLLPEPPDRLAGWPHVWHWDGVASIDPVKDAAAASQRLLNGTTTMARECAAAGDDWLAVLEQRAKERAAYATLGMPYPGDPAPAPAQTADQPTGDGNADPNAN